MTTISKVFEMYVQPIKYKVVFAADVTAEHTIHVCCYLISFLSTNSISSPNVNVRRNNSIDVCTLSLNFDFCSSYQPAYIRHSGLIICFFFDVRMWKSQKI